jgi:photosystem II stability/assembly factor-like uncharacterized protein
MTRTTGHPPTGSGTASSPRARVTVVGAVLLIAILAAGLWFTRSGDEGHRSAPVEHFMHIHGLETPAWADGAVYVSTHEGAFRIDDDHWQWVSEVPHDFMGFAAHPSDEGVLWSSGHPAPGSDLANPIGFMVSTDAGATWEVRSLEGEADFHAMAPGPDGQTIYGFNVAGQPGLYHSSDAGHSWTQVDAPALVQAGGAISLATSPDDAEVVLAGTEAGLLSSTDGGLEWQPLLDGAPVTAVTVDPADADRLVAYVAGDVVGDAGVVSSSDGGVSWEPVGQALDGDAAGHLAVDPTDPDTIWLGSFGESLWRTTDGGERWERLAEDGTPTEP